MNIALSRTREYINTYKTKPLFFVLAYTALFAVFACLVFGYFFIYRKSFIWYHDGLKQHYNAILYYSKYLKNIFRVLFTEHRLKIPLWDFSIGYGSDIITTLHYHGIGDPLAFLSVLVPERFMEYWYSLMFLIRAYIGGLGVSAFCLYHGSERFAALIGSSIYAFSAYGMVLGLMHGCFMVPVMIFPFIILGIDLVMDRKTPAVFIFSIAIAAISNFYFFYMQLVLAILYALASFLVRMRSNGDLSIKSLVPALMREILRFLCFGLAAICLAMPVFLPVVMQLFSSERYGAEKNIHFFYTLGYYLEFLSDFPNTQRPGAWTLMGYTPLASVLILIGLVIAINDFKRKLFDKNNLKLYRGLAVFFLLTIFLVVPFFGFALNGFAYVTNRWVWAYSMCVSFIVAQMISVIRNHRFEKNIFAVSGLILIAIPLMIPETRTIPTLISDCLILAIIVGILITDLGTLKTWVYRTAVLVILSLGLMANSYIRYSLEYKNEGSFATEEFLSFHEADKKLKDENPDTLGIPSMTGDFYRIEEERLDVTPNSSMQRGVFGTQFYFSITNPYVSRFIDLLYMNWPKDYDYRGLDNRSGLSSLCSVRYALVKDGEEARVPVLYDKKITTGETSIGPVTAMENPYALSLGYAYDGAISSEDFEALSVTERMDVLTNRVVLDDEDGFYSTFQAKRAEDLMEEVETSGYASFDGKRFFIGKNGRARIRLKKDLFDKYSKDDSEIYLIFKNLRFKGITSRDSYDDGMWAGLRPFEKRQVEIDDRFYRSEKASSISATYGTENRIIEIYMPGYDFYCGRHNFLCAFRPDDTDTIELSFRHPGIYEFDEFEVSAQSMDRTKIGLAERGKYCLENIAIDTNTISGSIETDSKKILVLTVPFSKGWKAYVDGEKHELKQANIMFTGIPLNPGKHDIMLIYETPYLRVGLYLFSLGLIATIVILIINAGRRMALKKSIL